MTILHQMIPTYQQHTPTTTINPYRGYAVPIVEDEHSSMDTVIAVVVAILVMVVLSIILVINSCCKLRHARWRGDPLLPVVYTEIMETPMHQKDCLYSIYKT